MLQLKSRNLKVEMRAYERFQFVYDFASEEAYEKMLRKHGPLLF